MPTPSKKKRKQKENLQQFSKCKKKKLCFYADKKPDADEGDGVEVLQTKSDMTKKMINTSDKITECFREGENKKMEETRKSLPKSNAERKRKQRQTQAMLETALEREERLEADAEQKMLEREERKIHETTPEREERLEEDAERKMLEREERAIHETTPEREERLEDEAVRKRNERAERDINKPFPPVISDDVMKECVTNYIKATSNSILKQVVCGICAGWCDEFEIHDISQIPSRELIHQDSSTDQINLEEYKVQDLILHKDGVYGSLVNCCLKCLSRLKKGKLPALSIANNFQIGETPPELSDLTLPEKLLISVYRPKIFVTTFRSVAGPGTSQRGLKGNTITFPQDVVKISKTLPSETNCLSDLLKVIFVGAGVPCKEAMKKKFTVRRKKVYDALEYLKTNHPLYFNVEVVHSVKLPDNDIPKEIWELMTNHEDIENEDQKEHSSYIPQTIFPDSECPPQDFIMESSGVLDLGGDSVSSGSQLKSALDTLQGTMIIPHGQLPLTDYNNPLLWVGAYSWLFPHGTGGPEIPRTVPVSLKAYVRHLLVHADRKFRLDLSFKFHVFNVMQKRDVSLHSSLLLRSPRSHLVANQIGHLSHDTLVTLLQSLEQKTSAVDSRVKVLLDNLSSTGAQINGSPYCKKRYRREIFGLMIHFGMSAYFITVSPSNIHSPIVLFLAGEEIDLDDLLPDDLPSSHRRAQIAAEDPVSVARFFNIVIDAFTKYLLGYNQPNGGILGHVAAYYGCIEEQGTGTLHIHMLVWLDGFSSRSDIEAKFTDEIFKTNLLEYLEKVIKQGYFNDANFDDTCLNVSNVSCKRPINPADQDFDEKFTEDVNSLVAVANTHRHTFTCYKYRKNKECRFRFPRTLVDSSRIEDNEILLRRTSAVINNYNPYFMTCIRCNHDINFIPSGRDAKACVFYTTDYTTKSSLSAHQMVPLIASSMKKVELQKIGMEDAAKRSQMLITKCLNRILTETEMSASHVCHFLLGNFDKKTSHTFCQLNLHTVLKWISEEENNYDNIFEDENLQPEDDGDQGYFIEHGNSGLILTNQLVDYLHRGDQLEDLCLYKYVSTVYKSKLTAEEERKFQDSKNSLKTKVGRKLQARYYFSDAHPQSETHLQIVRAMDVIPALSFLPPSEHYDREKFFISMLALFKPFFKYVDLYNGISWEDSFRSCDFDCNDKFIKNIEQMHQGIEERKKSSDQDDSHDEQDASLDDHVCTDAVSVEDGVATIQNVDLDDYEREIMEALGSCVPSVNVDKETFIPSQPVTMSQQQLWQTEMKEQSERLQEKLYFGENSDDNVFGGDGTHPNGSNSNNDNDELDIHFEMSPTSVVFDIQSVRDQVKEKYSLNPKQAAVFDLITCNTVKRLKGEPFEQIIAYIGGAGGTGKSQIIKTTVDFFEKVNARHEIRLSAYTGTAAKLIGGKTISSSTRLKSVSKLEKIWRSVTTSLIDEVSMTGCRLLAKLSSSMTNAKHGSPDIPFGGVDMFFSR